jgi:hypothetical protein
MAFLKFQASIKSSHKVKRGHPQREESVNEDLEMFYNYKRKGTREKKKRIIQRLRIESGEVWVSFVKSRNSRFPDLINHVDRITSRIRRLLSLPDVWLRCIAPAATT